MNLVKQINQYDSNCIFFCDPIKNNIMNEGCFIRIVYSNNIVMFNGIYLLLELSNIKCDKYYNKYKCLFDVNAYKELIENIKYIEEDILKKYSTMKTPSYKIYEQMKYGYIKLFDDIENATDCKFVLKISGIWETLSNYGLTYKFIRVN